MPKAKQLNLKDGLYQTLLRTVSSFRFFVATLAVYAVNAAWLALSGLYPMAFDEQFHLGLIRLYGDRLTPFWTSPPADEAIYGALARDPSYMYHYLLSWPFRLMDNFITSEVSQVIILRFLNVFIVGLGIWVFRKVLLGANFSRPVTHISLALFAITPIVPFFGAQINYDPLVFLLVAVSIRLTQQVVAGLQSNKQLDAKRLLLLAIAVMFGSLVKYAFLPIVLAVLITLGWRIKQSPTSLKQLWLSFLAQISKLSGWSRLILVGGFIVLFGLCFERYGVNTLRYRTPTPECDQVLSVDECMPYSPWRRNYLTTKSFKAGRLKTRFANEDRQFVRYSVTIWLSKMTDQLFFTIDGATSNYKIGKPFRAPRIASVALMVTGLGLFIWYFQVLRKRYKVGLFLLATGLYCGALLAQNYLDYLHIGYPFAIQGRYLLPILPLVYVLLTQSFSTALGKFNQVKMGLTIVLFILFFTQASGAGTYILRSSREWWWPNKIVIRSNETAKKILGPFIIGK